MLRRTRIIFAGFLLAVASVSCVGVLPTIPLERKDLFLIKKIAVVVSYDDNFSVFHERVKASPTAEIIGLLPKLIAGAYNESADKELAKPIAGYMEGFSCGSVFRDLLTKTLTDSKRFSQVEVLDKEPASTAISKYDAILTFRVVSWGIRLIQEEPDLMSPFIELEVKMVYVPTSKVLWDDCDKYIGQNRFPLHAYQNQKELCKKEIQETIVDVVEYISRMLLPPKTSS